MLIEINEIDIKEFLIWASQRAFCNSGQHVCDRLATIFDGIPAEDRYDCEPKPKPLAQYLDEYLSYELTNGSDYRSHLELLEQALDAYESTENVKIRIERV